MSLKEMILEYQPVFLGPSSLQGRFPWNFSKQVPEEVSLLS